MSSALLGTPEITEKHNFPSSTRGNQSLVGNAGGIMKRALAIPLSAKCRDRQPPSFRRPLDQKTHEMGICFHLVGFMTSVSMGGFSTGYVMSSRQ